MRAKRHCRRAHAKCVVHAAIPILVAAGLSASPQHWSSWLPQALASRWLEPTWTWVLRLGQLRSLRRGGDTVARCGKASTPRPVDAARAGPWASRRVTLISAGQIALGGPQWSEAAVPVEAGVLEEEGRVPKAPAVQPDADPVLDAGTGLLAPSTRAYLNRLLRRLQAETGVKVRVICPPAGLQQDREAFREYSRAASKSWGLGGDGIVIVAEERIQKLSGRSLGLLTISLGFKIIERFQYQITNDFVLSVVNKFGDPGYTSARGTDLAIQEATENIAAAIYNIEDKPKRGFVEQRARRVLPEDKVAAILKQHS